ncbi:hypothetical protein ACVDG3_14580 [Meridianimarinicoccus sp. RP-17]|uniref:hypothetical protein n=1 Tax=Meridianimarinicoccus zhengii TaxID=2056810 RepID=UPI000DAD78CA|nr:hypothetical protein [Phycocomes zhengii]
MAVVELTRERDGLTDMPRLAIRAEDISSVRILDTKTSAVNVTLRDGAELNLIAPAGKIGAIYTKIMEAL